MARVASGFTGFPPQGLAFFTALAANNSREWFQANKPRYDQDTIAPFRLLLAALISTLAARDIPLTGDPAKAIFRIHRDVRFSHDKLPYKTHAGAVLTQDGAKNSQGLLYIHIDPTGSFMAAGFWQPDRDQLGAIREAIYTEPDRFTALQDRLAAEGLTLDDSESLVRMPRGFEDAVDTRIASVLRLKSFVMRRPISTAQLGHAKLADQIADFAETVLPLLAFGWSALTVLDVKRS